MPLSIGTKQPARRIQLKKENAPGAGAMVKTEDRRMVKA